MKKSLLVIILLLGYISLGMAQTSYTLHAFRANISTDTGATGEKPVNIPVTIYTTGNTDSVRKIEIHSSKQIMLTVDSLYHIINLNGNYLFESYCTDQDGNSYYLRLARGKKDKTWSMLSILNNNGLNKERAGQDLNKEDTKGNAIFYLKP